jgi:hypothetical protein
MAMNRSFLACGLLTGSLTAGVFAARTPLRVLARQQTPAPSSTAQLQPTEEKPLIAFEPHHATAFHTSDRCVACHNGMTSAKGEPYSIGFDWQASVMANAARDPYWQGSIRRETIDHPESSQFIQSASPTATSTGIRTSSRASRSRSSQTRPHSFSAPPRTASPALSATRSTKTSSAIPPRSAATSSSTALYTSTSVPNTARSTPTTATGR